VSTTSTTVVVTDAFECITLRSWPLYLWLGQF